MNASTLKIRLMQADDFNAVVAIDAKVLKASLIRGGGHRYHACRRRHPLPTA
jgi:hypothetical protein